MTSPINSNYPSFNITFQLPTDVASDLVSNPNAQAALNLLQQLAQSEYGGSAASAQSVTGGSSLPSPFAVAQLTELINNGGDSAVRQQLTRQLADMNTAGSRSVTNNITVNVPGFTDRANTVQSQTSLVAELVSALQSAQEGGSIATGGTVSSSDQANRSKFDADLTKALANDGRVGPQERKQLMADLKASLAANPNDDQYYKNDIALANTGSFAPGANQTSATTLATALNELGISVSGSSAGSAGQTTVAAGSPTQASSSTPIRATSSNSVAAPIGSAPPTNVNPGTGYKVSNDGAGARPADDGNPVNPQDVFSGDPTGFMSKTEVEYYNTLKAQDPDKANLFLLQTKMQKLNEMITFLTQMMTIRHDNAKAILQNLHV